MKNEKRKKLDRNFRNTDVEEEEEATRRLRSCQTEQLSGRSKNQCKPRDRKGNFRKEKIGFSAKCK